MEKIIWNNLAEENAIEKAVKNLKDRNIEVEILESREKALERIGEIIPPGASVMSGGSTTLSEIGFVELLKSKKHPWKNLKDEILTEKDEKRQNELRKKSVLADYFLGSVHAVAETGEVVAASATGSQLPAYTFTSNIVWIVGTQKITPNLETAVQRVREYVYPLEDQRMKNEGEAGSMIGKLVIFEREFVPKRIRLIFVKEKLGF